MEELVRWETLLDILSIKKQEQARDVSWGLLWLQKLWDGGAQDPKRKRAKQKGGLHPWPLGDLGEYRHGVWWCRDRVRKAKPGRDMKCDKKLLMSTSAAKGRVGGKCGPTAEEDLSAKDTWKSEALNPFFISVFTGKAGLPFGKLRSSRTEGRCCGSWLTSLQGCSQLSLVGHGNHQRSLLKTGRK